MFSFDTTVTNMSTPWQIALWHVWSYDPLKLFLFSIAFFYYLILNPMCGFFSAVGLITPCSSRWVFLTGSILEALCDCPLNTGIMFNVANLDCCLMLMTAYQAIIKYVWGVTMHCLHTAGGGNDLVDYFDNMSLNVGLTSLKNVF